MPKNRKLCDVSWYSQKTDKYFSQENLPDVFFSSLYSTSTLGFLTVFFRKQNIYNNIQIKANATKQPTTIPAIAPGSRPSVFVVGATVVVVVANVVGGIVVGGMITTATKCVAFAVKLRPSGNVIVKLPLSIRVWNKREAHINIKNLPNSSAQC